MSIDWSREISTHAPEYYRWTQWIFLRLFERGLAYRAEAAVQWCPDDQTVLANEQVIDGRCERCGTLVEARDLEQWFFKITDYADRLLADFDLLESWPEHVITMQRNWIGRSEGAEVVFRCEELELDFPVFTTRPDTLFGATFFVVAPEHPTLERLAAGTGHEDEVREYVDESIRETAEERGAEDREKTGVPLGRTVTNPVNGEQIPMFVADYVLMEYGTGALMAVPAHDGRDFDFATAFGLPIRRVVAPRDGAEQALDEPFLGHTDDEVLVDSGEFSGLGSSRRSARSSPGWRSAGSAPPPSTTAFATGCSPASATGALRSRSSTATDAARWPCPTTSSRSSSPRSTITRRRARARWRRSRTGSTTMPLVRRRRPGARPTRWTPSSIPRGTSSATSTRATPSSPATGKSPTSGCRSTSTSAESSTRSCT